MAQPLRVGIVGSGFMGTVHARAASRAGARLVAVATRAGGADVAARLGAERAVERLDQLLGEVDVVHLCTPNALHAGQVRAVLAAGAHVVCEKPLAPDVDTARALTAEAAAAGRVATVPFAYRYYGSVRQMRALVRAGGPLVQVRGSYLQDWLAEDDATDWRVDAAVGGPSRAFGDIGVHWADLAEFVTGHRIARLVAVTRTVVPHRGGQETSTEDLAGVLFETADGVTGQFAVSQVSWGRASRISLEVDARDAAWAFDSEREEVLWRGDREGGHLLPRGRSTDPAVTRLDRVPAGHPQGYQDCFDAFVADTYAAVGGAAPDGLPTFADGARAAEVTAAVLASAASGSWVDVGAPAQGPK
ncbi:Gfo/Idh/MocA family protein [Blastococcus sp. SYSU D00695]